MKYYLRSSSTDLQTNEISASISQKEFCSLRKNSKKQHKKSTKTKKLSKRQSKNIKESLLKSKNKISQNKIQQKSIIHEKILRFPLKYKKSTLRVYCYKQSDLGIPRRFSRRFIQHKKDDDQESWDSLIESEVKRCKKSLFDSVRKYSEALSQKSNQDPIKQQLSNDEVDPKSKDRCKKKKKITKRKKKI